MKKTTKFRKSNLSILITVLFLLCIVFYLTDVSSIKSSQEKQMTSTKLFTRDIKDVPTSVKNENPITVAVNPGHGGKDAGAEGIINEKEMTEKTGKYLYDLLSKDSRFKPIYARGFDSNQIYTNSERAQVVNDANAQLLISIHGNSDPTGKYSGFECFAVPPGRKNHKESLKFATIIASKMEKAKHKMRGENGVRFIYYVKNNKGDYDIDLREYNYSDTARTDKTFGILEKPNCPSILVEQGFVNSQTDYQNWGNDKGCLKAANIYYQSICEYFNLKPLAL